jgi:glutamyl-Q tRNA(Asp) synthetase
VLPYVGRFAPSPTGALHFGSLIAALGSCLQARSRGGRWLVRIEDLDPLREVSGTADAILHALDRLGFEWDGPVVYQSGRTEHYREALAALAARDAVYECSCSRKDALTAAAGDGTSVYPGTCRAGVRERGRTTAVRVRTQPIEIAIDDRVQGLFTQQLERDVGDFVVRRRDGWFAYQLAVVVDDHLQAVSEVVRGADLLDSTPRQRYLQDLLGLPHPDYVHLPVAVDAGGNKLSKQSGAPSISQKSPGHALYQALVFLDQHPPAELCTEQCVEPIWKWAVKNWRVEPLRGVRTRVWGAKPFACDGDGN